MPRWFRYRGHEAAQAHAWFGPDEGGAWGCVLLNRADASPYRRNSYYRPTTSATQCPSCSEYVRSGATPPWAARTWEWVNDTPGCFTEAHAYRRVNDSYVVFACVLSERGATERDSRLAWNPHRWHADTTSARCARCARHVLHDLGLAP
jgi:hypothetical protein